MYTTMTRDANGQWWDVKVRQKPLCRVCRASCHAAYCIDCWDLVTSLQFGGHDMGILNSQSDALKMDAVQLHCSTCRATKPMIVFKWRGRLPGTEFLPPKGYYHWIGICPGPRSHSQLVSVHGELLKSLRSDWPVRKSELFIHKLPTWIAPRIIN